MNVQTINRLSNRITQLERALERVHARVAHLESAQDRYNPPVIDPNDLGGEESDQAESDQLQPTTSNPPSGGPGNEPKPRKQGRGPASA